MGTVALRYKPPQSEAAATAADTPSATCPLGFELVILLNQLLFKFNIYLLFFWVVPALAPRGAVRPRRREPPSSYHLGPPELEQGHLLVEARVHDEDRNRNHYPRHDRLIGVEEDGVGMGPVGLRSGLGFGFTRGFGFGFGFGSGLELELGWALVLGLGLRLH